MSKPAQPTAVEATVKITIEGKTYELSKKDAIKLRDQISEAVTGPAVFTPVPYPQPYPVPVYRERPWHSDRLQYGTETAPYRNPYEIYCSSTGTGASDRLKLTNTLQ